MELIEVVLSKENLNRAYKKVVANRGAGGVDGVTVEELGSYIRENREKIVTSLRNRTYIPKPVRRVYIVRRHFKWSSDCTVATNKNLPIKASAHTACGKKRHAFFLHRTGKAV